jgi:2-succinyl-5-enolpyruvyl-6-hydroxy-3-cyclohexene-1-carboxylate synthase
MRVNGNIHSIVDELTKLLQQSPIRPHRLPCNFKNFIENKRKIIEDAPLSYPSISKMVIESLIDSSILYIANSTAVRSFDSYCSTSARKQFSVATNRGVSGIEGFIASACGYMDGIKKDVYLIVGDISLMHDLNSLYFLPGLENNLKIILINNFGGGIFTLLPISQEEEVLSLITSPHRENFKKIADNFNLHYLKVTEVSALSSALIELQNLKRHAILEIFVDHQLNKAVYDQLRTIKIS